MVETGAKKSGAAELQIRQPTARDGQAVYECVTSWGGLDVNSPYAYFLICDRFAEQSAIGELDGKIAGFVMGLDFPNTPETVFVWQVAVSPEARGLGVGGKLISAILERVGARYLEAHVGATNEASEALFRGVGKRRNAKVVETVAYPSEWFPPGHDTERLLRIGPLRE